MIHELAKCKKEVEENESSKSEESLEHKREGTLKKTHSEWPGE